MTMTQDTSLGGDAVGQGPAVFDAAIEGSKMPGRVTSHLVWKTTWRILDRSGVNCCAS